jgi:beta-lactamase class A
LKHNFFRSLVIASTFLQIQIVEAETINPTDRRIYQLVNALNQAVPNEDYFTSSFLSVVSTSQFKTIAEGFNKQYGKAMALTIVERKTATSAALIVDYELAKLNIAIELDAAPPYKVKGLLVQGVVMKNDNMTKINADFQALLGRAGYTVQKLTADGAQIEQYSLNGEHQYAIASVFKLYVLAELIRQVDTGQRRWSDVVPLNQRSISSRATQNWPKSTPVTVQTLATWMISVSDNAATDALIQLLGREAIEKSMRIIGLDNAERTLPLLTTVEAFALKSNPVLKKRYEQASLLQKRDLLSSEAATLTSENINAGLFNVGPIAIDTIEWFASPSDLARLLNHIRQTENKTALEIMAINKGLAPANSGKWKYLGYKGGAEPGVSSMSFLLQSERGSWYAVSGSWNDSLRPVNESIFLALMTRLLNCIKE